MSWVASREAPVPPSTTEHTDTWVYKKSKHEFCVLDSKHALWCKNRSLLVKNCHWWWKPTQIGFFETCFTNLTLLFMVISLHIVNQVFQCIYFSSQEYIIPWCVKILPFFLNYNYLVAGWKEMVIFEISGLFMYHCVSVCSAHKLLLE